MTEEARIRLTLDAAEARKQLERFQSTFQDAAREAGALGGSITSGFGSVFKGAATAIGATAFQGFRQGVVGSAPGGGLAEGALGGAQAGLTAVSSAAQAGATALGGPILGQLTGAATDLALKPVRDELAIRERAREQAIGAVQGRFGAGAERGGQLDPEVLARAIGQEMERAMRRQRFEADVRRQAPSGLGLDG